MFKGSGKIAFCVQVSDVNLWPEGPRSLKIGSDPKKISDFIARGMALKAITLMSLFCKLDKSKNSGGHCVNLI
jgi:hypothetical protein